MIRVELSPFGGFPRPTYRLARDFVARARRREVAAAVYELAAKVERASLEAGASWVVVPEPQRGLVYIEGADTPAEVEAAVDVLRTVERA